MKRTGSILKSKPLLTLTGSGEGDRFKLKGLRMNKLLWRPGSILGYTTRRRNRIRNRLLGVLDYDYEYRFAEHEHENRSDGLLPICTLL